MRKKLSIQILLIIFSFLVALSTTYTKVEVTKHSDLENLSCGWPIKFVVHDDSLLDPPMPWKAPCGFLRGHYGQGSTKEFNWQYFILDAAFFYLILSAVFYGWNFIRKKK